MPDLDHAELKRIAEAATHHGRHPWAQPGDRPHRVWMLRFDDADQRDMVWIDEDAEEQAKAAYARYSPTWNCYLFAVVPAVDHEVGALLAERDALVEERDEWKAEYHRRDADVRRLLDDYATTTAQAARLREVVEKARDTFHEYAKLHSDKRTDDGDVKALRNHRLAQEMEAALHGSARSEGGGEEGAAGRQTCGAREPISRAAPDLSAPVEGASPWRCHKCGADFTSADGKIVGGTCPHGRPTCPLVPA
jgi:hypothetical protein